METRGPSATSVRVWDGARVQLLRLRRQASAPETLDSVDIKYLLRDCCRVVLPACKTMQAGREREREGGRKGEEKERGRKRGKEGGEKRGG